MRKNVATQLCCILFSPVSFRKYLVYDFIGMQVRSVLSGTEK